MGENVLAYMLADRSVMARMWIWLFRRFGVPYGIPFTPEKRTTVLLAFRIPEWTSLMAAFELDKHASRYSQLYLHLAGYDRPLTWNRANASGVQYVVVEAREKGPFHLEVRRGSWFRKENFERLSRHEAFLGAE